MAYDNQLANRVRQTLAHHVKTDERAMFGGLAFMVRGHMCCGLVGDRLMVRVDPDEYDRLLTEPGAAPMDFTGKPMRGFLYVTGVGLSDSSGLNTWIARALEFVNGRPPKVRQKLERTQKGGLTRRCSRRAAPVRANGAAARRAAERRSLGRHQAKS